MNDQQPQMGSLGRLVAALAAIGLAGAMLAGCSDANSKA